MRFLYKRVSNFLDSRRNDERKQFWLLGEMMRISIIMSAFVGFLVFFCPSLNINVRHHNPLRVEIKKKKVSIS